MLVNIGRARIRMNVCVREKPRAPLSLYMNVKECVRVLLCKGGPNGMSWKERKSSSVGECLNMQVLGICVKDRTRERDCV